MFMWWLQRHWDIPLSNFTDDKFLPSIRMLRDADRRAGLKQTGTWHNNVKTMGELGLNLLQHMEKELQNIPEPDAAGGDPKLGFGWKAFHRPLSNPSIHGNNLREWQCMPTRFGGGAYSKVRLGRVRDEGGSRNVYEYSHRLLLWLMVGPPHAHDEWLVMHKCDHANCLQPDHLYYGSHMMNNKTSQDKRQLTSWGMLHEAKFLDERANRLGLMPELDAVPL